MVNPIVVLYDLTGKPYEVENVTTAAFYPDHLSYTTEKGGEQTAVFVPLHRVHEVRS